MTRETALTSDKDYCLENGQKAWITVSQYSVAVSHTPIGVRIEVHNKGEEHHDQPVQVFFSAFTKFGED